MRLLKHNGLDKDPRCDAAKAYLKAKKQPAGYWKVTSSYLPKCWIQFDKPGNPGLWISHETAKLLD
ncbi:MAG: hypothetical protein HC830_05500 [Bacteroidetes bacterium]|nr:hypothetical protein [Bacteroidota bacterium]